MRYKGVIYFLKDLYWCGIPLTCRRCPYLKECRGKWRQGRKCLKGCIKLNEIEQSKILRQMTEEDLDRLLRREQDKEGPPDVDLINAIFYELESRGITIDIDTDAAWKDFVENYLNRKNGVR